MVRGKLKETSLNKLYNYEYEMNRKRIDFERPQLFQLSSEYQKLESFNAFLVYTIYYYQPRSPR